MGFDRLRIALAILLALACAVASGPALADAFPGGVRDTLGPGFSRVGARVDNARREARPKRRGTDTLARLRHWNRIAIDASGLDHTPVAPGEDRVFGEQLGPGRSSRAMAIVHIAMFDAINAIEPSYKSYTGVSAAPEHVDGRGHRAGRARHAGRALSVAARRVRRAPRRRSRPMRMSRARLRRRMASISDDAPQQRFWRCDRTTARSTRSPASASTSSASDAPGKWRHGSDGQSPIGAGRALGRGGSVRAAVAGPIPGSATTADDEPPIYGLRSTRSKRIGGDGIVTPTRRTPRADRDRHVSGRTTGRPACARRRDSTTRSRCRSPRAAARRSPSLARLLALVNVAMADAGTAIWESKYYYQFWRPVTGIREASPRTGPTGVGDGNPATHGDPTFTPLGAPASAISPDPISRRPSPPIRPGMPDLAARCSRRCATSIGPTASPSPSCPTN